MKLVIVMILLSYADLGFGVFALEAPGQRCVAMSSGNQDRFLVRTGGNDLVAGPSGSASGSIAGPSGSSSGTSVTTSTVLRKLFPNQSGEECPYDIVRARKYEHPGTPLSGAYCVEMLPREEKRHEMYNRELQKRVCKLLRHEISSSQLAMWADGFVYLEDVLGEIRKHNESLQDLAVWFRASSMHTQLDDSGVRFKIVYLASRKQWRLPVSGDPGFRTGMKSADELRAVGIRTAGELRAGFYIRVEGGMSEHTHCRVIQDFYRTRYTPEHPKWKDSCIHGTDKKFAQSMIDSGLICGGAQRISADRRAEIHLVNALVGDGVKTLESEKAATPMLS